MVTALFVLFVLFTQNLQAFSEGKFKEKIEEEAKEYFKKNNGAGLAIAVIKYGCEMDKAYEKSFCYGFSKRSRKTPVNERTQFRLGSLSKIFTTLLLLKFVDQNRINLEEKVEFYLPKNFPFPSYHDKKVKVSELALEVSGLPFLPTIPMKEYQASEIDIKQYFKGYKLNRLPGKKYESSELGFSCLAYLLARVAGHSYEATVKEEILTPLNMEETYFSMPLAKMHKLATGYRGLKEVGETFIDREGSFFKTSRGYSSNIEDMKRCLSFLLKQTPTSFDGILKHLYKIGFTFPENSIHKLSIGWRVSPLASHNMVPTYYQKTCYEGFSHFIGFIPEIKSGIVILSNSEYPVDGLGMTLLQALNE